MKRWIALIVFFLFMALCLIPARASTKGKVITPGDFVPDLSFPIPLSRGDVEYLGLPTKYLGLRKGDTFFLKDIKRDLIVLEYMNKYCFSCQLQAPVMNQVFEISGDDPQLRGMVKFLAVAAGNNQNEVDSFKAEKKIPFPILPDPKFQAYDAIGDPGATPFTLFIRKTESGMVVTRAKVGLAKDPRVILKEMQDSLKADWNAMIKQQKDPSLQQAKAQKLLLRYTEDELLKKAKESMLDPKWKVLRVAKVKLSDDEDIYVGEIRMGNQNSYLFAKLASRTPSCDICHATHFFFTFNDKGMVINFLPLQVTKVDNANWDSKDIGKIKGRLVGRSILQPTDFDPQVDSVSSATITAALIVDSVNKAKGLYDGLKGKGYIK